MSDEGSSLSVHFNNMESKCKLCHQSKKLVQSHIIPKFVIRWLKETGPGFFRTAKNPNIKYQDLKTFPLLCESCEDIFSKEEDYFSREIFHPIVKGPQKNIQYSQSLYFFLISVLWRILVSDYKNFLDENKHFHKTIESTEQKWRSYLLNREEDPQTDVHLFITNAINNSSIPVKRFNLYLTRGIDGTITSNQKECFAYAKLARFCVFAPLTEYDSSLWRNTRVTNGEGILTIPQAMMNGRIGEFLVTRVRLIMTQYNQNISSRQKEKIRNYQKAILPKIVDSDFINMLLADSTSQIDPAFFPKKGLGRNTPCPCGSGKKYKKCCMTKFPS